MKYKKSENTTPLENMEQGKCRIHLEGNDTENIWVKKDFESNKAYLSNHALMFYPFQTWGLEIDLTTSFDMTFIRGENPQDTILTIHPEAFDAYIEGGIIDSEGNYIYVGESEEITD